VLNAIGILVSETYDYRLTAPNSCRLEGA